MKKLFITNSRECGRDLVRFSETTDLKDSFEITEFDFLSLLKKLYPSRSLINNINFLEYVKHNPFSDWIVY